MDIDLARHSLRTALRVSRDLQDLLSVLKEHCDASEYVAVARDIAAAIDGVNVAITNRVLTSHPELNHEVEADLAKYGRYL